MQENDPANERRRKSAIFRNLLMLDNLPTFPARGMTLSEIHTLLEDEGFELSTRTIQRDLRMISEWANLGYEDDDLGYRRWFRDLKKRNVLDILPTSEAFMLVLSELLLRRVLPLHQSDKLEAWLNQANVTLSSKHLYANWMKKVRVVSDNYPIIYDERHIDEQYRKIIYESVLNEKVISIGYQSSEVSDIKYYTLNPLALIIREQSHYLVATKEESPEVPQLFLFHKIISVQKEYLGITKPKSFTLDEYYAKNPTGWLLEDTLTTVELKVKHYALDVVKHNKLSIDQQLEQIDETWWKVTMTCYPTYDLIGWILKFGQDVVCLSPSSLKQFVVKRLRATIENYE